MSAEPRPVRTQLYWDLWDFGTGSGLEIGPLFNPLVRRHEAQVTYADVFSTEQLVSSYADRRELSPDAFVEVDCVLLDDQGRVRTLVDALAERAPFDWAIASHVIEHVPDLIGWMEQVAEVVVDDGVLVLAVPDKRYCFDVHRPFTTVGQMIEAHDARATRPSVRAVYDHHRSAITVDLGALWDERRAPPTFEDRDFTDEQVAEVVARARGGEYVDVHCWTFTPDSFAEQLDELHRTGLTSWTVEELVPTPPMEHEFRVRLRRVARDSGPRGIVALEPAMPGWQRERWDDVRRRHELTARVAALELENDDLRDRADQRDDQIARLEQTVARRTALLRDVRERKKRLQTRARRLRRQRDSARRRLQDTVAGPPPRRGILDRVRSALPRRSR